MQHIVLGGGTSFSPNHISEETVYDLDIIVPAYNVQHYIHECLDSLKEQETKFKYRVIVIDDGSTDETANIVDQYSVLENFLVLHQNNRGFSGARNAALSHVASKYIMFVDSDDYCPKNAIETLMCSAVKTDAAVVEGSYQNIDINGKKGKVYDHKEGECNLGSDMRGVPWGKVIKTQFFRNVVFPEGYWYEDSVMHHVVYRLIERENEKAYGISDVVYYYRINPNSISKRGINNWKCLDCIYVHQQLVQDRDKFNLKMSQNFYEMLLYLIKNAEERTQNLETEYRQAVFFVFSDYVIKYCVGYRTKNKQMKELEATLRNANFKRFELACLLL